MRVALLVFAVVIATTADSPPLVAFTFAGDRGLIYAQNPEQITMADLGDTPTFVSTVRVDGLQGKLRAWWELLNSVNDELGYGVVVTNLAAHNITVNITGLSDSVTSGAEPFTDVFSTRMNITNVVVPGGFTWVYRNDIIATNGQIFTGLVDFEVWGGPVRVDHVAYLDFTAVDVANLKYEGYITRMDPGNDDESRVYKGVSAHTDVVSLPLEFTFDDSVAPNSSLPVQYPAFNATSHTYASTTTTWGSFVTNDNPRGNDRAVGTDMVPIYMPGWGWVDPLGCCDASGQAYNTGNWAIVYTIQGTAQNTGRRSRTLTLTMVTPGCAAPIAYQSAPTQPWMSAYLASVGASLVYLNVTVAANSTAAFQAKYVVGGPACGGQEHTFRVN